LLAIDCRSRAPRSSTRNHHRHINKKFAKSDPARLLANLKALVCFATGGPCQYTGLDGQVGIGRIGLFDVHPLRGQCFALLLAGPQIELAAARDRQHLQAASRRKLAFLFRL
jgi:hypothetical protein